MMLPNKPHSGHLVLFLHTHLPFVRHPETELAWEESWLYEAITESYLPLISVAEGWIRDGIDARVTVSISPPLMEMLRDELLMRRYRRHLCLLLDLAEAEARRRAADERFAFTAALYRDQLADTLGRFERRYCGDVLSAFVALRAAGVLDLVTSCATHAYLPCFDSDFARSQIRLGVKAFRKHLGGEPPGMWLPECGFVPGLDRILAEEGLAYFLVDSHAVEYATPAPVLGTSAPVVCPAAVYAFPRDRDSSARVWSADSGYPGDGRYREFHRDLGYDLDPQLIGRDLLPDGAGRSLGLKYHRVTGRNVPLHAKEPYHRGWALEAVNEHADDYVSNLGHRFRRLSVALDRPPVLVTPFDTELFGHWWFEGPQFLDQIVRQVADGSHGYRLSTPTDVADSGLDFQVTLPAASSWGAYGYSDTWLNDRNSWIWPHLHHAAAAMKALAAQRPEATVSERRVLNQLARELLLATASDWPFMMTMGTVVDYAECRVRIHISRFNELLGQLQQDAVNLSWLYEIESRDNIFAELDYRDFTPRSL
jgi:1,4-alpha-glucan branching enzyme